MEQPRLDKLAVFIRNQMNTRSLNAKEFAKFLDVEPSQITRILNGEYKESPKMAFLVKLATRTHTDLAAITALLHPEATIIDAEATMFASWYTNLPKDKRKVVKSVINAMRLQEDDELD